MKIATPLLSHVVEVRDDRINSLVIENPICFRQLIAGIHECIEEGDEAITFSEGGSSLRAVDCVELIQTFVPFELNTKSLLSALLKRLEKVAQIPLYREATDAILCNIREYVERLTLEIPHPVICEGVSLVGLLKASGLSFNDEDSSHINLLLDYFRLVREFVGDRTYVLVNVRSYFSDQELEELFDICLSEKFKVLLIDGCAKNLLPNEDRLLVDRDLCELTQHDDNMV